MGSALSVVWYTVRPKLASSTFTPSWSAVPAFAPMKIWTPAAAARILVVGHRVNRFGRLGETEIPAQIQSADAQLQVAADVDLVGGVGEGEVTCFVLPSGSGTSSVAGASW